MDGDYAAQILPVAEQACISWLGFLDDMHIPVRIPKIAPYYPSWKGELSYAISHFIPRGENGLMYFPVEVPLQESEIVIASLHELGHAALYQSDETLEKDFPYDYPRFTEGLSEHIEIEGANRRGFLTHSLRKKLKHNLLARSVLFSSAYNEGYVKIARLRKKGVQLHELIRNPREFIM